MRKAQKNFSGIIALRSGELCGNYLLRFRGNFECCKSPTDKGLIYARHFRGGLVEPQELHKALPMLVGWAVLVLFPLFDGRVADCKSQSLSQLRHGQVHVDTFLA